MATVTEPITLDKSINTTENPSRNIADVLAEELKGIADNILPPNASQIAYDNTGSGLNATNVQDAIDEVISSQADVIADTMADLTENKTATVTDGVADFETIDGSLVKSLIVEIEPSQSGSGTPSPSNIRPITGWTQEDVFVVGKNRLPLPVAETKNGVTLTHNSDGSITLTGTASANTYFDFFPNGDFNSSKYSGYKVYLNNSGVSPSVNTILFRISTSSRASLQDFSSNGTAISTSADGLYFAIRVSSGYDTNGCTFKPMMIAPDETDSTFEPYHGKVYTTPFNQTVYGGTLDVLTGELAIDRGYIVYDGSEDEGWSKIQNEYRYSTLKPANIKSSGVSFSNEFKYFTGAASNTPDLNYYIGISNIGARYNAITSLEDWKTYLSGSPLTVVYELETPITISLTPQKVKSLVGENHISASTGDVTECKYSMMINGDDLEMLLS